MYFAKIGASIVNVAIITIDTITIIINSCKYGGFEIGFVLEQVCITPPY